MDNVDIQIDYSEPDPETNLRSATIKITSRDPKVDRPMFRNVVGDGASKIEEENQ